MFKKWFRLFYILYIIGRYNLLNEPVKALNIKFLKVFLYFNPFYFFSKNSKLTYGERLRLALEKLGPIFIKFGQALSVRQDLLPRDVIKEISKLQDDVPAFDNKLAISFIEKSLNKNINDVFLSFDEKPLASASIAQVHKATLKNGENVVIKVLRPNIHKILKSDTSLALFFVKTLNSFVPKIRRFKPIEVIEEINQSLFDELDLLREAANASQLKRNFEDSPIQYIPKIYWEHTTSDVMTMEYVQGLSISDSKTLDALGVNRKLLAERGVEIFYTQVFRDCFFHADMHPGNIFIDASEPKNPKYITIDFGIVGTLTREDQQYLAGNFIAFFNRNYRKVAELHIESGWVPANTKVDALESAIRTVCEPIFEKPISEISLGHILMRLFQVAKRFNMEVQPQLTMLQKTLINIEGLGKITYPELNIWEVSKPILESWMKEHIGFQGFISRSKEHIPKISEKFPDLPDIIFDILQTTRNNFKIEKSKNEGKELKTKPKKTLFFTGLSISIIGLFFNIMPNSNILINVQSYLEKNSSTISIVGFILIILYFIKKEK